MSSFSLSGVIPATLLCFNEDLSIDEPSSRNHVSDVANVAGVSAITVNGHASEVGSCSFQEQARILDFSLDEVGDQLPIISGVYADGSIEAAKLAKAWERAGASALLVFPSNVLGMGGFHRPEMAVEHFKYIADATDLPLIAFVYPYSPTYTLPLRGYYSFSMKCRVLKQSRTGVTIQNYTNATYESFSRGRVL